MSRNYEKKLSAKIISENYDLVYQRRRKVEIYRDTGVSKNIYGRITTFTFDLKCINQMKY